MTGSRPGVADSRARLEEQRDQALRDLVELDQQVAEGELRPAEAEPLRLRYERSAAEAITLLGAAEGPPAGDERPARQRRMPARRGRVMAVLGALAAGLVVVAVLLGAALQQRPSGGFVSGNEAVGLPSPTSTGSALARGRDLSKVSDAELERVVAANPGVLGMRLALARRYTEQGKYDRAVAHYGWVLRRYPGNPEALAHLGWVLLQMGAPARAERLIDRSLARDPAAADTWWFKANARLYGASDPAGSIRALRRMQRLPLGPSVRRQVQTMLDQAQRALDAGR